MPEEIERTVRGDDHERGHTAGRRVDRDQVSLAPDRECNGAEAGEEEKQTRNADLIEGLQVLVVRVRLVHRRRLRLGDTPGEIDASGTDSRERVSVREPDRRVQLVRSVG